MTRQALQAHALAVTAAARVIARTAAMQAENGQRAAAGAAPAYTEQNFVDVIDQEGAGYNTVIGAFQE
jgi:hypothetical protein